MAAPAPPARGAAPEPPPAEVKKSGKLFKLIALALIVAIVGAECLATFVFLASTESEGPAKPSHGPAAHSASHAGEKSEGDASDASKADDEATADPTAAPAVTEETAEKLLPPGSTAPGDREVDLGQYSLTVYQPTSGTTLLVDFHLFGTVKSKEGELFDERFEKHKHRIRDQVIITIRSAEMADFADPGLGLIKRQILTKSNALLGKRLVRSIMFSDFTFIEQ